MKLSDLSILRTVNQGQTLGPQLGVSFNQVVDQTLNHEQLQQQKQSQSLRAEMIKNIMAKRQASKIYKPLIYSTMVQLLASLVLSCFIFQYLQLGNYYEELHSAQNVIRFLQKQTTQPIITSVSNRVGCANQIGYMAGTDKGCICPDMSTSNQMCFPPCEEVPNMPPQSYDKFKGTQLCIEYGEEGGFNTITSGSGDITIAGRKYHLSDEQQKSGKFYKFIIAPNKPCYNRDLGQLKESELSYPFSQIHYQGCDKFGALSLDAVEMGVTSEGELRNENNIDVSVFPFYSKYFDDNDSQRLYLLRKFYVDEAGECQRALNYSFKDSYASCILIQVSQLMLCYFAFIFFGLAAISLLAAKLLSKVPKKPKVAIKIPLPEVLEKSVIILGIVMCVVVLMAQILFQYGINNSEGLANSSKYATRLIEKPCFMSPGIIKSVESVQKILSECTQDINLPVGLWVGLEVIYLVLGYFTIRKNLKIVK